MSCVHCTTVNIGEQTGKGNMYVCPDCSDIIYPCFYCYEPEFSRDLYYYHDAWYCSPCCLYDDVNGAPDH